MEVSGQYPAPVLGVSTLAERTRANGQMSEQINMSSDPVQKLTRRPPARWDGYLTTPTTGSVKSHVYVRDGKQFRILLQSDGVVTAFVNNVSKPVVGDLSTYITSLQSTVLRTINDTTVAVNQDKVVRMLPDVDTIEKVTHINVTSALNYGEKLVVELYPQGGTAFTVEYNVPDIGATSQNLDAADKARATAKVAESIASLILLEFTNEAVGVSHQGSCVAVWDKNDPSRWVDVRISTGQGEKSTVVVNQQVENIAGLPLYAVVGTRITVRPNPTSDKGTYYLEASRVSPTTAQESTLAFKFLEEVVWTESRDPEEQYKIDPATMPHVIAYDAITDSFYAGVPEIGWADRKTGDNQSCKRPAFIDNTITTVSYMQKRLVFISNNDVSMSKTDDIFNWWKGSAVQLVVTDPISIASSATGIDKLTHVVPHNKDLLVLASNAQFKIPGDTPVTPETISMPLVATYNCSTLAEPKALGSSVFIPVSYGESCGVFEYTREENREQDNATSVSNHVVGYMQGLVEKITTSANLDILVLRSTDSGNNTLFVFEQFVYGKDDLQQSWSKWVFPFEIIDFDFITDSLTLLYRKNGKLFVTTVNLYSRISEPDKVFLDRQVELSSADGLTFTLPAEYDTTNLVAVVTEGRFKLNRIDFEIVGNTLTLERNILQGNVAKIALGVPYTSLFEITRPFIRDQQGRVITDDRLTVTRFVVHLINTGNLTMMVTSEYYPTTEQNFVSRSVGGLSAQLGTRSVFTGDYKFSFGHEASQAKATFSTDDHLGLTVAGISWVGQHHQTRRRL